MIINDYVTGLCIYYTILTIVILECTPTYKDHVYCTIVSPVKPAAASDSSCLLRLSIASIALLSLVQPSRFAKEHFTMFTQQ